MTAKTKNKITARDGNGKAMRTPEHIAKDQQAAQLRSMSLTYAQIGERLGITKQAAHQAVLRAIADIPKDGAEMALKLELEKLDIVEQKLMQALLRKHLKVSNSGKVIIHEDDVVYDDQPVISAATALMRLGERRARLLGLNAPTRVEADVMIYDGMGEVERELYERALAFRRWQAESNRESHRTALPLAGSSEAGAEAS